ncbi:MAG TPA: PilW family protein [Marinagarivorans sp.]
MSTATPSIPFKNTGSTLRGFTLIELLIALALGLTLSGAITKVYLQNNASMQQDEQIARLQENARYALKLLAREISMAGFAGGTPDQSTLAPAAVATGCATDTWSLDLTTPLDFVNNAAAGTTMNTAAGVAITCSSPADLVEDTDILSIKRTADRATLENGVKASNVASVDNQWYLRLSDNRSDKSWVNVANGAAIESTDASAGSDVDYWAYYHKIYYLRNIADSGENIPTLCAQVLKGSSFEEECYVDGIENVQIELGLDTNEDSTPDIFKSNPSAAEMKDAVVVRLYLLARSPNEIGGYTNNKTYYLGTTTIANPNDGYFRRVYSTTIQIKNARLPNA